MTNHETRLTPSEQAILSLVTEHPDRFTLDELASEIGSTPGSTKVLITRLRTKGHAISSPRHRCQAGPRKGVPQTYRLECDEPIRGEYVDDATGMIKTTTLP